MKVNVLSFHPLTSQAFQWSQTILVILVIPVFASHPSYLLLSQSSLLFLDMSQTLRQVEFSLDMWNFDMTSLWDKHIFN